MNATVRAKRLERAVVAYARIALAAAFLSGVGSRFGLWGKNVGYGDFAHFVHYTARVNSFMPAFTIPFLAWAATVAEFTFGIALLVGLRLRAMAFGSTAASGLRYRDGYLVWIRVATGIFGIFRFSMRHAARACAGPNRGNESLTERASS